MYSFAQNVHFLQSIQRDDSVELLVLPDKSVDKSLDRIVHEIVERYINKWYNHYEVSKSNQFQDSIKYSLRLCFIKMGASMGKTHAAGLILMVVQTFLRHLVCFSARDFPDKDPERI